MGYLRMINRHTAINANEKRNTPDYLRFAYLRFDICHLTP
jgi:hypothetical protein